MLTKERRMAIENKLPVNDAKYIAFKNLKGILGKIDTDKVREGRTDEIIIRYQRNS